MGNSSFSYELDLDVAPLPLQPYGTIIVFVTEGRVGNFIPLKVGVFGDFCAKKPRFCRRWFGWFCCYGKWRWEQRIMGESEFSFFSQLADNFG